MSDTITTKKVVMGDVFAYADSGLIRGHGTVVANIENKDYLVASVTGVVEKVNKLVTVRPIINRYAPEIGDIIIGRVTEVVDKRWKLDINARQSAALLISSVNLPGGQRRRTDADSLSMRSFLIEGDLVSAEVQKTMADRSASLHTRSLKYGKLGYGTLVTAPASAIKRSKNHFHTIEELGIDLLIGHNGYIWICPTPTPEEVEYKRLQIENENDDELKDKTPPQPNIDESKRESIARLRNAVDILSRSRKLIYRESVLHVYNLSVQMNMAVYKMTDPKFMVILTTSANSDLK